MSKKKRDRPEWVMSESRKQRFAERKLVREKVQTDKPELFEAISLCLFQHDPMKINYVTNTDEYDPETAPLIIRLQECKNEADVKDALNAVLEEWLDWQLMDRCGELTPLAEEIWKIFNDLLRPS